LSDQPVRTFSGAAPATEPGRDYAAVLVTDAGTIVLDLTEAETPITVNSFVFLARNRYFDGVAFHRVLEGFVAQAGDPNTLQDNRSRWGNGGPGYTFGLELVPTLRFDARGVLGMARAASPTSNGSQFFITLAPTPSLNNMYTVFGRVLDGDTVLDRIARNAGPSAPPATPTRMTQVYIVERPR
jgi:cyclophilin family peptidyl-prolyl cis-trans isomerase